MSAQGGCHGKLAGVLLEQILTCGLNSEVQPEASTRNRLEPEDAALIEAGDQNLLVSTDLIHLPGVNLYDAGRIGALHALADIYASGGLPRWALVTLVTDRHRPLKYGQAVMAGVRDACSQEAVTIIGGHSVAGNEAMVGLSVVGVTTGAHLRKLGAQPGQGLFLSKPVGTGLCLAGFKHDLCGEETLAQAVAVMLIASRDAAAVAIECGATACTDVSGFGLLGHLSELLPPSMGAELISDAVPILPFAQAPPRALAESQSIRNNYEYVTSRIEVQCSAPVFKLAAFLDAQTNGPLLVAAPISARDRLVSGGYSEIGRLIDQPGLVIK
jgi:selenide,water dikinase